MINRLAIIGVGLIGGSLALALKQQNAVKHIVGFAPSSAERQQALALGIIDEEANSIAEAVSNAEVIFIAVPISAMPTVFEQIAPHLSPTTVITDGGSVKLPVVEAARAALGENFKQFVPGHPIAGTEQSGPSAAFPSLYQDNKVILTPLADTDFVAVHQVRELWQQVGAQLVEMSVKQHDDALAATSHLPHVLAFNLVAMLAQRKDCDALLQFAAGGFRDFSRIASSDAVMWRDICLSNSDAVLNLLTEYQQNLQQLEAAIRNQNGDYLLETFNLAKQTRDSRFNPNNDNS